MKLETLDSRLDFGTDTKRLEHAPWPDELESSDVIKPYPCVRQIRVIVGKLPPQVVRLSASEIDVVADADNFEEAWAGFLKVVLAREDSPWLAFDVGPTRPEEIAEGLDVPEDKDWSISETSEDQPGDLGACPLPSEFDGYATNDCVEFVNSQGLTDVLRECRNQVGRLFSNLTKHYAELDHFEEDTEDSRHVVIRVEVKSSQDDALTEYDAWVDWLINNVGPADRRYITLTMKRV